jgi:hypothetical protein
MFFVKARVTSVPKSADDPGSTYIFIKRFPKSQNITKILAEILDGLPQSRTIQSVSLVDPEV